jgi:hypothetical protein
METFNYLSVLVSIIAGLGMTHLLDGLTKLIQVRDRVKIYWVHLMWIIGVFFLMIQFWWGFWGYHVFETWTYPIFILFLLQPIQLLIASDLLFPDFSDDSITSLRDYYFANHRWLFWPLVGYLALVIPYATILRDGGQWISLSNGIRLLGVAVLAAAALSDSPRVHAVICIAGLILFVAFIVLYNTIPLPALGPF